MRGEKVNKVTKDEKSKKVKGVRKVRGRREVKWWRYEGGGLKVEG